MFSLSHTRSVVWENIQTLINSWKKKVQLLLNIIFKIIKHTAIGEVHFSRTKEYNMAEHDTLDQHIYNSFRGE